MSPKMRRCVSYRCLSFAVHWLGQLEHHILQERLQCDYIIANDVKLELFVKRCKLVERCMLHLPLDFAPFPLGKAAGFSPELETMHLGRKVSLKSTF